METLLASDIESIDALGDAINEFQGGVLVVSHDARLLTMTNCEMWLMDNQTVKPIEGGYEAYRDSLLKEMEFVGKRVGYIYLERWRGRRRACQEGQGGDARASKARHER